MYYFFHLPLTSSRPSSLFVQCGPICRNEFKRWCPTFRVVKFHGPIDERSRLLQNLLTNPDFDVLLTSYGAMFNYIIIIALFLEMIQVAIEVFTRFFMFRCIILDEAQRCRINL